MIINYNIMCVVAAVLIHTSCAGRALCLLQSGCIASLPHEIRNHVVAPTDTRGGSLITLCRVTVALSPQRARETHLRIGSSSSVRVIRFPHGAFYYNRGDTPINARGYCVLKCRGMLAPSMTRFALSVPLRRPARVCGLSIDAVEGRKGGG